MSANQASGVVKKSSPGLAILKISKAPAPEAAAEPPAPSATAAVSLPSPVVGGTATSHRLPAAATAGDAAPLSMADLLGSADQDDANAPLFTARSVDDFDFDEVAFQSALDSSSTMGSKGEEAVGTVVGHESDGLYVDIGGKAPGWMPKGECGFGAISNLQERYPKGTKLNVLVTREQNSEGTVTVSCRALLLRDSWTRLTAMAKEATVAQVVVNGFNRGGCTCDLEGLRGFIPRSHLLAGENHSALVGQTLNVTILEANPEAAKLVLSEKLAVRARRLNELEVGMLVTGEVSGIKRFGYFVDLGGLSGLLHQRCISAGHVRNVEEVFQLGETISALVSEVDTARGRIGLNTALLENQPGELLVDKAGVMAQAERRAQRLREASTPRPPETIHEIGADEDPIVSKTVEPTTGTPQVATAAPQAPQLPLVPQPPQPLPGDNRSA